MQSKCLRFKGSEASSGEQIDADIWADAGVARLTTAWREAAHGTSCSGGISEGVKESEL